MSYADDERAFWDALIAYEAALIPRAAEYANQEGVDGRAAKLLAEAWIMENEPDLLRAVHETRIKREMNAMESQESITQMNQRTIEWETKAMDRVRASLEKPKEEEGG